MSMNRFPPGSEQAVARSCICPVVDNKNGIGAYVDTDGNPVYWFSSECTMHGNDEPTPPDTLLIPIEYTSEVAA